MFNWEEANRIKREESELNHGLYLLNTAVNKAKKFEEIKQLSSEIFDEITNIELKTKLQEILKD